MSKFSFEKQRVDVVSQQSDKVVEDAPMSGVLTRVNGGFRFEEEAAPVKVHTRNPKVYEGRLISVVRQKDNSVKFSFKNLRADFDFDQFAINVYDEVSNALALVNN